MGPGFSWATNEEGLRGLCLRALFIYTEITMSNVRADFYEDLEFRGLLKQVTSPDLKKRMGREALTVYCGFDPTADSLHIGSLLPLLTLRRFQDAGHKVIAVVGGATGMIGDPSGKTLERKLLDPEQLDKNVQGITGVIKNFLKLDGPNAAMVVNNFDWFRDMSFIDFLRDVGKHFTVNHMMAKDSVKSRLEDREHGISYTEFSYMLLQAYDYWVLHEKYGCNLQIGGSDQWGNITAGNELIRRMKAHRDGAEYKDSEPDPVYGFTWPLVTKADGSKFGKTESGNLWLSSDRTSPYEFYQFLVQAADADVINYLKFFTFLPHDELKRLEIAVKTSPEKREAQTVLAKELVKIIHGEAGLASAAAASAALFGGGGDFTKLSIEELTTLLKGAPQSEKSKSSLEGAGLSLVELLAETGLCPSKGQARKDMQGGGINVNNERVDDPARMLTSNDLLKSGAIVLRKGKKNYHLVRFI